MNIFLTVSLISLCVCMCICMCAHALNACSWVKWMSVCKCKSCTRFCLFYSISKLLKCFWYLCHNWYLLWAIFSFLFLNSIQYHMWSYLVVGKVKVYHLELFVDPYNCCTECCSGLVGSVQYLVDPSRWCRFWYRNHLAWLRFCGFPSEPAGKCHDTHNLSSPSVTLLLYS